MEDLQIGLKMAIEATILGLHRAGALDKPQVEIVLDELDRAASAASDNLPGESELIESIADNVRAVLKFAPPS